MSDLISRQMVLDLCHSHKDGTVDANDIARMPSAEPTQNCVENALGALDCISRQAVEEIINDIRDCISVEGYCAILERMKKLPSVNPQEPKTETVTEFADRCRECGTRYVKRQTGHWTKDIDDERHWDKVRFVCSECGKWQTYGESDFCPNCGADMRGTENE